MSARYIACPLLALALLAGCSHREGWADTNMADGALAVRGDHVVLKPDGAPQAIIDANGTLRIDGKDVAVNDAQRALLKQYHASAAAVRTHGIETGKAGAKVAGVALKGVASNLLHGDGDTMQKNVDAQAKAVEQSAGKICNDLVDIQTAQDALAVQLPAFKPYAHLITGQSVADCKDDTVVHRS